MKKIILLLAAILLVSCSNEELGDSEATGSLMSIKENTYINNELYTYRTLTFSNDKLLNIKYKNPEFHDEYTYNEKGLVSKIVEYQSSGGIYLTTTFLYDNKDRITNFNAIPGPLYPTQIVIEYVVTYLPDKILLRSTDDPDNFDSVDFFVNANNSFTEEVILLFSSQYKYNFENGNLTSCSVFNYKEVESKNYSKYSYSNLKNEYNYKRFIFGKEWKLNSYLTSPYMLRRNIICEQSENLISEITDTYKDPTDPAHYSQIINTKFDYTVNDQNQMEKQVKTYTSKINGILDVAMKYELLYTYK
jgi:hypothetical protein